MVCCENTSMVCCLLCGTQWHSQWSDAAACAGDMCFNYGALPQTWEDPSHFSEETQAKVNSTDEFSWGHNCWSVIQHFGS